MIYLKFLLQPAVSHPNYYEIGQAIGLVMVGSSDLADARVRAEKHFLGQHWEVDVLASTKTLSSETETGGDVRLQAMYKEATQSGMGVRVIAFLVGEKSTDEDLPKV
jgi:hypothetical protein